jgi:hypothetical protein
MVEQRVPPNQGGWLVGAALRALGAFSLAFSVAAACGSRVAVASDELSVAPEASGLSIAESLSDPLVGAAFDGNYVDLASRQSVEWIDCEWECCPPVWTVRAGAVILDRSKPEDDVIARPLGGLLEISAGGDFDFGWSGGVDVYVARQSPGSLGVEVRYFNVDFDAGYDYDDTGNLEIGHTTISNLFDVDARYGSQLHSTEVNLRVPATQRVTWLAGFRWIELQERLNYDIELLSLINNDFRWSTDNHMYGGQLGLDLELWDLHSPLSINTAMKAGVYGNHADNNFSYHVNNFSILRGGADDAAVAFAGDIAVNLSYAVTRHVALMGGYQLLWINGAALASDQAATTIDQLDIDIINTSGDVFYHGATTGVEFSW